MSDPPTLDKGLPQFIPLEPLYCYSIIIDVAQEPIEVVFPSSFWSTSMPAIFVFAVRCPDYSVGLL